MIEISHAQARRFMLQSLNTALPDGQWAALQAHLETCADCRAYQSDLAAAEGRMRHLMRGRWARLNGPSESPFLALLANRQQRQVRGRRVRQLGIALVIAALLVLLMMRALAPASVTPPPGLTPSPSPSPQPTIDPNRFYGLVVYEVWRGILTPERIIRDGDLYLLNAGPKGIETQALTSGPANDSDPIWSPDGNWIAYLSNQSPLPEQTPDQQDIYVMSVAGTHRTRLTADPNYVIRGPLTWSADGQWLAALAKRRVSGMEERDFIYMVPTGRNALTDPGGRPLTSRWPASGNPLFAPQYDVLAYPTYDSQVGSSGIIQIDIDNGLATLTAPVDSAAGEYLTGAFDWSLYGLNLTYTVANRGKIELRTTRNWSVFPKGKIGEQSGLLWGPDDRLLYLLDYPIGPYPCSLLMAESWAAPPPLALLPDHKLIPAPLATLRATLSPLPLTTQVVSTTQAPQSTLTPTTPPEHSLPTAANRFEGQSHVLCISGPGPDRNGWVPGINNAWLVVPAWTDEALTPGTAPLLPSGYTQTPAPDGPTSPTGTFAAENAQATGYPPTAIYAITYPMTGLVQGDTHWQKLVDLPPGYTPGRLAARPDGEVLDIHPVEALSRRPEPVRYPPVIRASEAALLPSDKLLSGILGTANGQIMHVVPTDHGPQIEVSRWLISDGRGSNEGYQQAELSPDGEQIAVIYLNTGWHSEVLVSVPDQHLKDEQYLLVMLQVSQQKRRAEAARGAGLPEDGWVYDQLAWSPDGKKIAALVHAGLRRGTNEQAYALDIIDLERTEGSRMIPLGDRIPTRGTRPVWTLDGTNVLLPLYPSKFEAARVVAVDARTGDIRPADSAQGLAAVDTIALAPDGKTLAYVAQTAFPDAAFGQQEVNMQLRFSRLDSTLLAPKAAASASPTEPAEPTAVGPLPLRGYNPSAIDAGYGWARWTSDNRLLFLLRSGALSKTKTHIFAYDDLSTASDAFRGPAYELANLPHQISAAAWSPDGAWLIYTTADGTFLLNLDRAEAGEVEPIFLGWEAFDSLEWR